MQKLSFSALGLSPEILKAVAALGFEETSPIQSAAIPPLLEGKDIFGQSQTGSGKTAAFGIPAIEFCDPTDKSVQILILCPTRELATQVADEVHKLSAFKRGIHAVPIYGGASYERQFHELKKGVQIVIGTPGRLIDHLERGTLKLDSLKMVILDEADRMLDMGFRDDIRTILDAAPTERQTVFFSATVSRQIRELINRYARDPELVKIEPKEISAPAIEQFFYETPVRLKLASLIRLIDFHGFKLGIIFCNTQRMVDELADALMAQGFSADRLHGGIAQAQRTRVMNKFKKAEFEFLVATDVAARGIDVDHLELVVNYDLPYDAEDYVHRIGRTGRAGRRGMAMTFVSGREIYKLQFIERYTKTKIRRGQLPTADEVEEKKTGQLLDKVREILASGDAKHHAVTVDRLLMEGCNSTDIAAALLHLLSGGGQEAPTSKPNGKQNDFVIEAERSQKGYSRKPASKEEFGGRPTRLGKGGEGEPVLRKPSRGLEWVSVGVGRRDGFGPKEIVDLIEDASGLPGRSVGMIELTGNRSFAQVPESFAKGLSGSGNRFLFDGREIGIQLVKHGKAAPAFKRRGGRPKFKKKWQD